MPPSVSAAISGPTAVVWADPARDEPQELTAALGARGIHVLEVGSAYMATAQICSVHRDRQRTKPDNGPGAMLALVIVGPEDEKEAAEVCLLLWQYAGGAPCWLYGPPSAPKLRPIRDEDLATWSGVESGVAPEPAKKPVVRPERARPVAPAPAPAPERPKAAQTAAPQLRLAGTESSSAAPKESERIADPESEGAQGVSQGSPPLLTPEELEMLLGDPDEASREE
jgi:hypothetical protein